MKKTIFILLVSFMIVSILGIVALQGYWIYSAWEDKEEEFSLAVQQSLQLAADEITWRPEGARWAGDAGRQQGRQGRQGRQECE